MSTLFLAEGNIGSAPEYREFTDPEDGPRRLIRLSVYFDNPVPSEEGFEDRGGFWVPVELWHDSAHHWSTLYQKGMRVMVLGKMIRDQWEDAEHNPQATFKIRARSIGILPYRIASVVVSPKGATQHESGDREDVPG